MAIYYPTNNPSPQAAVAAGTNQGTATELPRGYLTTVSGADGTAGVRLPPAAAGDVCRVYNPGASGLPIYPQTGGAVNGGAANAAVTLAAKKVGSFECIDAAGNWCAIYS